MYKKTNTLFLIHPRNKLQGVISKNSRESSLEHYQNICIFNSVYSINLNETPVLILDRAILVNKREREREGDSTKLVWSGRGEKERYRERERERERESE